MCRKKVMTKDIVRISVLLGTSTVTETKFLLNENSRTQVSLINKCDGLIHWKINYTALYYNCQGVVRRAWRGVKKSIHQPWGWFLGHSYRLRRWQKDVIQHKCQVRISTHYLYEVIEWWRWLASISVLMQFSIVSIRCQWEGGKWPIRRNKVFRAINGWWSASCPMVDKWFVK